MPAVTFYGASDDLVEVEGAVSEEYDGDDVLLLVTSDTRQSYVHVKYERTGTWSVALFPVDEDMPAHAGTATTKGYSAYLTVGLSDPFTIVRVQPLRSRGL